MEKCEILKISNDTLQSEITSLQERLNKIHQILNSFGAPLGSSQYFEILALFSQK